MRALILAVLLFIGSDAIAESSYPEHSIPKTCMGYVVADKQTFADGLIFNGMSPGLCSQILIRSNNKDAVLDRCLLGGYSGEGGQAFHLKADSDSGRSRAAFR